MSKLSTSEARKRRHRRVRGKVAGRMAFRQARVGIERGFEAALDKLEFLRDVALKQTDAERLPTGCVHSMPRRLMPMTQRAIRAPAGIASGCTMPPRLALGAGFGDMARTSAPTIVFRAGAVTRSLTAPRPANVPRAIDAILSGTIEAASAPASAAR